MNTTRDQLISILRYGLFDPTGRDCEVSKAALKSICELAVREGLSGFLIDAAEKLGMELPEAQAISLREQTLRTAATNLHHREALAQVAKAFAQNGLDVMALKGMVLIDQVYERCELRPMGDVDLMIRPHQVSEGCRTLEDMGCSCGAPLLRDDFFPRFYYERAYYTPGSRPIKLDVHARPFRPNWYRRGVPDNALWPQCESIDVEGQTVLVPVPHRALIHLLTHAAVHGAGRLLWLLDVVCYCRRMADRIDWDQFVSLTADWRLAHPVSVALRAVEATFAPVIPTDIRDRIQALEVGPVDQVVLWHAPQDAAHPVRHGLIELLTMSSMTLRLGYLRALLFPQRGHLAGLYPRRHWGWVTCARFWRLIRPVPRLFRSLAARPVRGVA